MWICDLHIKKLLFFHPLRNAWIPGWPKPKFSGLQQALWLSAELHDLSESRNIYFSLEVYTMTLLNMSGDIIGHVNPRTSSQSLSENTQSRRWENDSTQNHASSCLRAFPCWAGGGKSSAGEYTVRQTMTNAEKGKKSARAGQIILGSWEEGLTEKVTF